jgi:PAS domain S-box-containing protein
MAERPTGEAPEQRVAEAEYRADELRRVQEGFRNIEKGLDLALDSASLGEWEWDLRTGKVVYNERWARELGHPGTEVESSADAWEGLAHPDDRRRVNEALKKHHRRLSDVYTAEFRVRTRAGKWRWILSRGKTTERDAEGRSLRMIGIHLDIDDRKRVEEALRESEAKYKTMAETAPDAVITTDLTGTITYVSTRCLKLFGYERAEELVGRKGLKLMAPAEFEKAIDGMKSTLGREIRNDVRYNLLRKDGTTFAGEVSAAVVRDGEGEPTGFVVVAKDITDRSRAEEAMQASEQQFRTLAETSLAGIYIFQGLEFRYVNPAAARMFGYEVEEITNELGPLDFVHSGDHAASAEYGEKCLAGSTESIPFSFRGLRRDGSVMDCEVLGRSIDFMGSPAVIGTVVDVSERKCAEQEVLRAQKFESIGVLAGGVAHDFNNLIMAIWGNIDLAKVEMEAQDGGVEYLEEAERACRRAQALAQQLITFSRGGTPVRRPTSVARVVREAADLTFSGSNVRCELSLPDDLWSAWVDEGQVDRVFNNLLLNAMQAIPEGGIVRVSAENTILAAPGDSSEAPRRYVEVSVRDQGIGIKKENLSKIFDPYFTTKQKGSGLGLTVVHSIVTKHDGHVSVESEVGRGTEFRIRLPACEAGSEEAEKSREGIVTGEGKILVMDDEEMVRKLVGKLLVRLGYEVELAEDGAEAVDLFHRAFASGQPFDVAILDLTIPGGMGGKETITRLLEVDPEIKAIVSSGYSNDPVMADCERYGFVGIIAKPYQMGRLGKVVKRVISMTR